MHEPTASERVNNLVATMSLEQKVAQLVSFWVDQRNDGVAPLQMEMMKDQGLDSISSSGLGHLTRVYGTWPVDVAERSLWLNAQQVRIREASGHGIGVLVHEECLTGLAVWKASAFPTPLAWGSTFNPELVRQMAERIGQDMARLGIHQGLAPVLDVIADPRWGRVEECIGEDPYLVGTIGTAYVEGLQSAGVDATLKHFVGYSASKAARNHAPVSIGKRELADTYLPPFEMAVIEGKVQSVMNSYTDIDGVPVGADRALLTDLLRTEWGFNGVVVADYYSIAFLEVMHKVAASRAESAALALSAGIDVELPGADAYPELIELVKAGKINEDLIDTALFRVLTQKERHGLLDPPNPVEAQGIDLDSPQHRAIARQIAEESLILLSNHQALPVDQRTTKKIAVIGPNFDSTEPLMGCYSFLNHVLAHHPGTPTGIEVPTVLEALKSEFTGATFTVAAGCTAEGTETAGFAGAIATAEESDMVFAVMGDRSGLFGRGTIGEGNDSDSLELPGVQRQLVEQLCATGKPVVLILLTGRPYSIDWALDGPTPPAAVIQAFFPGEEGAGAIARVLSGRVNPSGRLSVSMPRSVGLQPYTYRHPLLGGPTGVTSVDNSPARPFGFGLSYTTFATSELTLPSQGSTDSTIKVSVNVKNVGTIAGTDTVQLYGQDLAASVTRPVAQLLAYQRVALEPQQEAMVTFEVPVSRLSLTGAQMRRIVEPGDFDLWVGPDCQTREVSGTLTLSGPIYHVQLEDPRRATATISVREFGDQK